MARFKLDEKRLICSQDELYKICISQDGCCNLGEDIVMRELEQLIRSILPMVKQVQSLKLQTDHFIAEFSLTPWNLLREIKFMRNGQNIKTFPNVIHLKVSRKTSTNVTDDCCATEKRVRNIRVAPSPAWPLLPHFTDQPGSSGKRACRVSVHRKLKTEISSVERETRAVKRHARSRLTRDHNSQRRPHPPLSNERDKRLPHHTLSNERDKRLPHHTLSNERDKRLPHHTLSNERDKTLIALEDIAEETKVQQLSSSQEYEPGHNQSFIAAALSFILSPVKLLIGREK